MISWDKNLKISEDGNILGENVLKNKIIEFIDAAKARITASSGDDEDCYYVIEIHKSGGKVHLKLSSDK